MFGDAARAALEALRAADIFMPLRCADKAHIKLTRADDGEIAYRLYRRARWMLIILGHETMPISKARDAFKRS